MTETPVPCLLNLQPELLLEIISHVEDGKRWHRDLMCWSNVSSYFRSLLAPYIFTSITLRNKEAIGASINLIAQSEYRHYVKYFYFVGTAPGTYDEGFEDVEGIFPDVVESALANLGRFPNLEKVRIQFALFFDEDHGFRTFWDLFESLETTDEQIEAEGKEAWRALNTKVYAALARNVNPGFKHLSLDDLIPVEASSFTTPEFQELLGHMTHFDLSLWNDANSHYCVNTLSGYGYYTNRFDELFFNHLSSVTHLSIDASAFPMGMSEPLHGALRLHSFQMPLLKSLYLNFIFVGPELRDFLTSHAHTLERIELSNCHAGRVDDLDFVSWAELFTALANEMPPELRTLCITSRHEIELLNDYHATLAENAEATRAVEFLKKYSERRLFSHACIDFKYGYVSELRSTNLESFRRGDDQRAYDELIRIVELNSKK